MPLLSNESECLRSWLVVGFALGHMQVRQLNAKQALPQTDATDASDIDMMVSCMRTKHDSAALW